MAPSGQNLREADRQEFRVPPNLLRMPFSEVFIILLASPRPIFGIFLSTDGKDS